ncbi:MAG TPA: hypothetical protein VI138_04285, partial [Candidatus Dormibacteraeota bacterium]
MSGALVQLATAPGWFPLHFIPSSDLAGILPLLVVGSGAVLVLLADLLVPRRGNSVLPALTAIVLLGGLGVVIGQWVVDPSHSLVFDGAFTDDRFALFSDLVVLGTALAVVALSPGYLRRRGMEVGEYYILLLASVTG